MSILREILNFIRRWFLHLFEGRSLKDKRERYRFGSVGSLPGLNVQNDSSGIPVDETPSLEWIIKVAEALLRVTEADPLTSSHASDLEGIRSGAFGHIKALEVLHATLAEVVELRNAAHNTMTWPQRIEEYNDLFSAVSLPEIASEFRPRDGNEGWFDDAFFANLRTAGFNPMVIEGTVTVPEAFGGLTNEIYKRAVGAGFERDTLAAAADDGRLYYCDYSKIAALIHSPPNAGGNVPRDVQKYVYAPHALFALPPTATEAAPATLVPVAIRLTIDGPLFYPNDPADTSDGLAWTQAKYAVNSADGSYHELISHLGWTHLVIEPFAVCTQRNLRERHELYRLLVPHLEGTIFINNAAAGTLINKGGQIDQLLGSTIVDAQRFAVDARGINASGFFKFNQQFVHVELARRNVLSKRLLFPYRDDAIRIWDVIASWVSDYVDIYYRSDREVQGDVELQNWATELASSTGGQIQDFGDFTGGDGKAINTKTYLKEMLTMVIYTASAQHAAVNFAQSRIMAYAPAAPLALYHETSAKVPSEVHTYSPNGQTPGMLPPDSIAKLQLDLLELLGGVHYTQLGQYGRDHFQDNRVREALDRFQNNLVGVEQEIENDNTNRPLDYPYLLPSQIPQSINI